MNNINTNSPSFGMQFRGLNNPYFKSVSPDLIKELTTKALQTPNTDYIVELMPAKNDLVFVKKIVGNENYIVDYFPKGYSPVDVIRTFIKTILPEHRVMGKQFRQEANRVAAERLYRQNY